MTDPCVDPAFFDVTDDGVLGPHPWLQWRRVATNSAAGALVTPTDTAQVLVHDVQLAWTNDSPIDQHAYGLCTRGSTQVITTANKRFVVEQRRGWAYGSAPADPDPDDEISRHGGGCDFGTIAGNAGFGVWEHRQGEGTTPIGPDVILTPGQTLKLRVAVYVVRISWSPNPPPEWAPEAENLIDPADTQLDIFAYPVIT